jgi:ABC-type uncharacterized transport system permease subunit
MVASIAAAVVANSFFIGIALILLAGLVLSVCYQALTGKRATLFEMFNIPVINTKVAVSVNSNWVDLVWFFAVRAVPNWD